MQGFYMSNHLPLNVEDIPPWMKCVGKPFPQTEFMTHLFYNKHNPDIFSYYENTKGMDFTIGDFLANNGTFIYGNRYNKEALKWFRLDMTQRAGSYFDMLSSCLRNAKGQFIMLAKLGDKVFVITDKYRSIPVYLYQRDGVWAVSNIYYLLTRNENLRINKQSLAERVSTDWNYPIYTGRTLFAEISILEPGAIYAFAENGIDFKKYWSFSEIEFGKYSDYEELMEDLEREIREIRYFLNGVKKISCDITGGFDTRLNVEMLADRDDVVFRNEINMEDKHLSKGGRYSEINVVYDIVSTLGLNYQDFNNWLIPGDLKKRDFDRFWTCPVMSQKRFVYYNALSRIANICVSGFVGTELMTVSSYHKKTKFFDAYEYIKKHQPYVDVVRWYNKGSYIYFLEDYLLKALQKVDGKWEEVDKYWSYLIYITAHMESQLEYWNNANLFLPVYSPFFDLIPILMAVPAHMKGRYEIQRKLYQKIMRKELREINTTHGYPACEVDRKNFHRFLRLCIPFSDYNLQYFTALERMKRYAIRKFGFGILSIGFIGRFIYEKGTDSRFSFLNRSLVSDLFSEQSFRKAKITKQQIDWIKRLDRQLEVFCDKLPTQGT